MDSMLLRIFQGQVLLQCQFSLFAAEDLDLALKQRDIRRAFFAIQNLVSASANLSKALWGIRGTKSIERQELRDSIGIAESSPLRTVHMRNKFEHFDERLDEWWMSSARHNYLDLNIVAGASIQGIEAKDIFRTYNSTTEELIFWSETFNIRAIVDEVKHILPEVTKELEKAFYADDD